MFYQSSSNICQRQVIKALAFQCTHLGVKCDKLYIFIGDNNSMNKTQGYLEKLSKDELIGLVLKFAPSSFIDSINNQFSSKEEAMVIFDKVLGEIEDILANEDLLYNPGEFERFLLIELEKIRGLWDKLPVQTGDLIIKIIEDIEESFNDGYLYIENYGKEDDYFESEEVNNYVFQFTKNIPSKMKISYIKKLKKVLNNSGYSTFLSVTNKL